MTGRRRPIRYRHNPRLLPVMGPKTRDDVGGFLTYEGYLVTDEEGQRVDSRYDTYDVRTGRDREGQLA